MSRSNNGNGGKSWAGVIVVIVTLGGTLGGAILHFHNAAMQTTQAFIAVQTERMKALEHRLVEVESHAKEEGHPGKIIAMVEKIQKEIDFIADELKSHKGSSGHPAVIRDIAKISESLSSLSIKLEIQIGDLKRRLEGTEKWEEDHDRRVVGTNAAQWERIKALERAVFGDKNSVQ